MSEQDGTTYTVTQSAVQQLLDAVQAPGAMPQMQRDWIVSWLQQNLTQQTNRAE